MLLNGWQKIKRVDGNSLMSFGTQLQYKPNATTTLNYSTFIGSDKPDSARLMRYFHNLYAVFNLTRKLGITTGFDIGMEPKAKKSSNFNTWYSPVIILKYAATDKWSLAARAEYYDDERAVIITTGTPHGFQTTGYSLNIDYAVLPNAVMRLEARMLNSRDDIFARSNEGTNNNIFITSSIAIGF